MHRSGKIARRSCQDVQSKEEKTLARDRETRGNASGTSDSRKKKISDMGFHCLGRRHHLDFSQVGTLLIISIVFHIIFTSGEIVILSLTNSFHICYSQCTNRGLQQCRFFDINDTMRSAIVA